MYINVPYYPYGWHGRCPSCGKCSNCGSYQPNPWTYGNYQAGLAGGLGQATSGLQQGASNQANSFYNAEYANQTVGPK